MDSMRHYVGSVGMEPDTFWGNTPLENYLFAKSHAKNEELLMILTRNIEFSNYNTAYAGMNGKRVFKKIKRPSDLYKLPSDSVNELKVDKKAFESALDQLT